MRKSVTWGRALADNQQDRLAREVLDRARALGGSPTRLSVAERAAPEAELAAARRGELATAEEAAAVFAKHGL